MNPSLSRSAIGACLERQIRDQGARIAIHSEPDRRSFSFEELGRRNAAWTGALRRAGIEEGQTVSLGTGNRIAFVELFFALRSMQAAVLLVDESAAAAVVSSKMGASWLLHAGSEGTVVDPGLDPSVRGTRLAPERSVPPGTALVKLTSGSTLSPRGACFSEVALVEGIDHILRGMEIRRSDRVLISIPLSHGYGFDNGVLSLAA